MCFVPFPHGNIRHAAADQMEGVVRPPLAGLRGEAYRENFTAEKIPPAVLRNAGERTAEVLKYVPGAGPVREVENLTAPVFMLDNIVAPVQEQGDGIVQCITAIGAVMIEVAFLRANGDGAARQEQAQCGACDLHERLLSPGAVR